MNGDDGMNHDEMKSTILFKYHKFLDFWWRLLGEFCERTEGFTRPYNKRCILDYRKVEITWANGSWEIKEI